ncbi:Hypothetical predicted protein [Olea europaea subsp. europaea]|uniref:Uncharacterized protein n=1 Tax=Olea europaea subsp. europaea TaxID=158383 RepID=A0A8S0QH65_OLEEU|nr:Hypothetical predicted protein [Olea europaea subsp. europaea]
MPVLDDVAKTVIASQFNDGRSGSDRDNEDTEDSGNGHGDRLSNGEDNHEGQTSASSTPRVP